jgi:hypothetical protein
MKPWLSLKNVAFSLCFLYCMLAITIVNICLVGDAYSQLPELKVFDGAQVYEKGIQAQRQREEIRRIQLQNQMLQQEMRERERQRQNRILEEKYNREREKKSAISADIETKKQTEQDIYTELIKLDDLKQKGIITEEEFETQKKKILSGNNTYAGIEKPNTQKSCEVQCAEMFNTGELKKGMDIDGCIEALCGN